MLSVGLSVIADNTSSHFVSNVECLHVVVLYLTFRQISEVQDGVIVATKFVEVVNHQPRFTKSSIGIPVDRCCGNEIVHTSSLLNLTNPWHSGPGILRRMRDFAFEAHFRTSEICWLRPFVNDSCLCFFFFGVLHNQGLSM